MGTPGGWVFYLAGTIIIKGMTLFQSSYICLTGTKDSVLIKGVILILRVVSYTSP